MNYRLNVIFTYKDSGNSFNVLEYFAADGTAAETYATSWNKWRVHFFSKIKLEDGLERLRPSLEKE